MWDQESRDLLAQGNLAGAIGRTTYNIGTLVVPGVGVAKLGKAGKLGKLGKTADVAAAGKKADAATPPDPKAATRDKARDSCEPNSFTATTPVLMADGSHKPIKDVTLGDKVLATDPTAGRTSVQPVLTLIRHHGPHTMVDLTLTNGAKLTATDHHPIWDATTRTYTDAINLTPGHQLLTPNGHTEALAATTSFPEVLTAYNLEIATLVTYYVLAGNTPVLVHNSCGNSFSRDYGGGMVLAEVDSDGILNLAIQGSPKVSGSQMFADAMGAVGSNVKGVRGTWVRAMPDNLDSFNAGIQNSLSPAEAASHSFTGKMAAQQGFTNVRIEQLVGSPGEYTKVSVVFTR